MEKCEVFNEFQVNLSKEYGVPYGCGEIEGKSSNQHLDEPWVICPNCEEPIYMTDCIGDGKDYYDCPSCCCVEDGLLED